MLLYFSFNLGENDNSGLPTYSAMFLDYFKNKEMVVINIIADPVEKKVTYNAYQVDNYIKIDAYLPNFLTNYKPELEQLIKNVIEKYDIDIILQADYLTEEYLENIDIKRYGIKKALFIHLLYAGLMNKFVQEPYFEDHIMSSMVYLGKNAHTEWKAIVTSDVIICNSLSTADDLRRYYPYVNFEQKELYATPLGVQKDKIPYAPNLESNKWAYFGRLDTMKGLWYLSKDWVLNPDEYKKNPPIICGDGMLEMLFMKAHFTDGLVDYRGNQDKESLYEILKDVKYCVFPSIYEPYGLALNEAMSMGKICIVSNDVTGMREQVDNFGNNGIIFDFRNDSIVNFVNNNNLDLSSMPENAHNTARDINKHFEQIENILFQQ